MQEAPAGTASQAPVGVAEAAKEPSRFPGVDTKYLPLLEEVDRLNPKLVPAWLDVRRLQAEWDRNFAIFGKQARRNAEREMATIERAMERAMKTFCAEYERIRKPWLEKEEALRAKAAQLSERKPESSVPRQEARDAEVSRLYSEAMTFYEKSSALAQLEQTVTIENPPQRLDQVGVTRGSFVLESLSRPEIDALLPLHLALRDALADVEGLQARKAADAANWRGADEQQLAAAERELHRSLGLARKAVAALKKPHEGNKARHEKKLEALTQRIERSRAGNRSTEKLDLEAVELVGQIEKTTKALEAIDAFGDWAALDAKWPESAK